MDAPLSTELFASGKRYHTDEFEIFFVELEFEMEHCKNGR